MAGVNSSFHCMRPKRWWSLFQPSTAPGTVTVSMPLAGIFVMPLLFRYSIVSPLGAQPLAFSPYSLPVFASQTIANRSPPTPFMLGSITPSTALAAMAALAAEPPCERISAPACEACTWLVATMPYEEITIERALLRSWPKPEATLVNRSTKEKSERTVILLGSRDTHTAQH